MCARPFVIPHFQFEFLTFCRIYFFFGKLIAYTFTITCFVWLLSIFPPFHISMVHTFPLGRRQNNHYAKAKAIDISSSFFFAPKCLLSARVYSHTHPNTQREREREEKIIALNERELCTIRRYAFLLNFHSNECSICLCVRNVILFSLLIVWM